MPAAASNCSSSTLGYNSRTRFKIKSLLLLTLLLAILIAFFVKPYTAAVAERNAIKALEKHWQILVDGNAALGKASWSPKPIDDGDQGAWYHWPATLIAGEESLKRLQYLRLVKPLGKELSLKPLSTMDKVSHLTFNLSRHQLSDSDCRCIGRMSSLVSLEISCQASGGFESWQRLPLKRLVIRGPDWEQEDFDAIGNIAALQFLQLDTTKITRENLGSLSKLKHLKTMCLVSSRKKEGIAGLDASTGGAASSADGILRESIPGFMNAGDSLCESFNDGPSRVEGNQVRFIGALNEMLTRDQLLNVGTDGVPIPFPVVGETAPSDFYMQDTRDFFAVHGKGGNVLFADGSVRVLEDVNGDGYFNPGFNVPTTATSEETGYLDGFCEVNPWDMYPGTFLDIENPLKDFDRD